MSIVTDDLRIERIDQLITPEAVINELHLDDEAARFVLESRRRVEAVLKGDSDRLLVVVGPCSIHDPAAALEYFRGLRRSMGSSPDPARRPDLVDREIEKLERQTAGASGDRRR